MAVLSAFRAVVIMLAAVADLRAQGEFTDLMRQGKEASREQRMQDAEAAFRRAVALEPLSAEALDALGDIVYQSGNKDRFSGSSRFDEAKGLLEKAVGIDPNSFAANYDLARIVAAQCIPSLMQADLNAGPAVLKNGELPYGPERQNLRLKIENLLEAGFQYGRRSLEINPNSPAAMHQMSSLLMIRAHMDETPEKSETDREAAREWARKANEAPQENPGVVRIGKLVAEHMIVGRVDPIYPPLARAARIQGTVEFTITIDEQGHVMDVKLVRGHPLLVNAAKEAVRQWVYKPTLLNGQSVKVMTIVDVPFRLEQ